MDAKVVHTIHDEFIVEAKADIAEEVACILKDCTLKPFEALLPSVPFKVELEVQDSWGF
jgi:DNA polymerase-1